MCDEVIPDEDYLAIRLDKQTTRRLSQLTALNVNGNSAVVSERRIDRSIAIEPRDFVLNRNTTNCRHSQAGGDNFAVGLHCDGLDRALGRNPRWHIGDDQTGAAERRVGAAVVAKQSSDGK